MILSEDGFRAISDENAKDGSTYRIQFKKGVNIQKSISEIKSTFGLADGQLSENTTLLGLMGQSKTNIMQSFYMIALILVILVLFAGTVMISASFNIDVKERTQFYGLLRCLGGSKTQIKHFVIVQGLKLSMASVPFGLIIGQIITWAACVLLRYINSSHFSEIPLFEFSLLGLISGTVVGFVIVLLAALSPAREASKVSPLVAISGNTQLPSTHKAIHTELFHVETGMGVSHAFSSKKNIALMTCSFAISIILFLSFHVMVKFLDQAMPALSPFESDIAITDDNNIAFSPAIPEDIQALPEVKWVYGNRIAYDVPISSDKGDGVVTLISYADTQLDWANKDLVSGNIGNNQNGQSNVLSIYKNSVAWKDGDPITIRGAHSTETATVSGVISRIYTNSTEGSLGYLICSEQLFESLVGKSGYNEIHVRLTDNATDNTVAQIRTMFAPLVSISDKRLSNKEVHDSYYTGAVFIYGFLVIIALITVFNIFNSMNASVSAHIKQYGIMCAIGMSTEQIYKMIASEAVTYTVLGCIVGCVLGLPLNRIMFHWLITNTWGTTWQFPVWPSLIIVILCLVSAGISILLPVRRIRSMTIVDTIKTQN